MNLILVILASAAWAVDAATYFERARAAAGRGDLDEAVTSYRAVLRLKGEDAAVRHNLSRIYMRAGMIEKALEEAKRAVELVPKDGRFRTTLASIVLSQEEPDLGAAAAHLRRAVALLKRERDHPGLAAAYYNLGLIARKRRKLELARSYFNQAFMHNPADEQIRSALRALDPAALKE